MRTRVFTFVIMAVLLMFCAVPAYGQGLPPLPHAFYGTVEINDSAAPTGTQVEARGEGVRTGIEGNPIGTTAAGVYGSAGSMGSKLVVQGDILDGAVITFYVNGVSTGQTAEWHNGEVTELDLSATITAPGGGGGGGIMPPDTIPPRISDVLLSNPTEASIDISWKTQELSDSQVEYWASPSNFTPLDTEMVINHIVRITDLNPGTAYYYRAMSKDSSGNLAVSDEHTFTTLGTAPLAAFTCSTLSISPSEVNAGEAVTVSVLVTNTGNAGGSYEVALKINDVIEATKEITLDAGASQEVTFTTVKNVTGSYLVEVKGLKGSFTVAEKAASPIPVPTPAPAPTPTPPTPAPAPASVVNWPVIGSIIGGVIVVGIIIFLLARRKRA